MKDRELRELVVELYSLLEATAKKAGVDHEALITTSTGNLGDRIKKIAKEEGKKKI